MLECGLNFKGSMKPECVACGCPDDEEHRLNHCIKCEHNNFRGHADNIPHCVKEGCWTAINWNFKVWFFNTIGYNLVC